LEATSCQGGDPCVFAMFSHVPVRSGTALAAL
jgi:hypothetical protein